MCTAFREFYTHFLAGELFTVVVMQNDVDTDVRCMQCRSWLGLATEACVSTDMGSHNSVFEGQSLLREFQ